jgi:hypothetical protein
VFARSDGVWQQQGATLDDSNAVAAAENGFGVALAIDNGTLLVGTPYEDTTVRYEQGAARFRAGWRRVRGEHGLHDRLLLGWRVLRSSVRGPCNVCTKSLGATQDGLCTILPFRVRGRFSD